MGLWPIFCFARGKLEDRGARRRVADEDDVALSAFKSLCVGAARGRYPILTDRDDLWRLLIVIAARKASSSVMSTNSHVQPSFLKLSPNWISEPP